MTFLLDINVFREIGKNTNVAAWLDTATILAITREADLCGVLLAESDKRIDDTGLVATARVDGLTLVTRNLRHVRAAVQKRWTRFSSTPKITKPNVP